MRTAILFAIAVFTTGQSEQPGTKSVSAETMCEYYNDKDSCDGSASGCCEWRSKQELCNTKENCDYPEHDILPTLLPLASPSPAPTPSPSPWPWPIPESCLFIEALGYSVGSSCGFKEVICGTSGDADELGPMDVWSGVGSDELTESWQLGFNVCYVKTESYGTEFCNYDDDWKGFCEPCHFFQCKDDCLTDGLPEGGVEDCMGTCFPDMAEMVTLSKAKASKGSAKKAVDGDQATSIRIKKKTDPWFAAKLPKTKKKDEARKHRVHIWNVDSAKEKKLMALSGVEIWKTKKSGKISGTDTLCGTHLQTSHPGPFTVECPAEKKHKYITIKLPGKKRTLSLAEIVVEELVPTGTCPHRQLTAISNPSKPLPGAPL